MTASRSTLVQSILALSFVALLGSSACAEANLDYKAAPSGAYNMDQSHTSVVFKITHLGFSHYTGRFDKAEGTLNYNASSPGQSSLDVTIFPNSVNVNSLKLEEELRGDKFFDVIKFQRATFHATKIELTGAASGKVTGDFTLHGVTKPLTLDVTLVGTGSHPFTKKQVLGFSATGTIHRSDFGITNLVPMVGDDVTIQIDTEFDKAE